MQSVQDLMLYRAWCGVSKHHAQQWEHRFPHWDACKAGSSALQVAFPKWDNAGADDGTGEGDEDLSKMAQAEDMAICGALCRCAPADEGCSD